MPGERPATARRRRFCGALCLERGVSLTDGSLSPPAKSGARSSAGPDSRADTRAGIITHTTPPLLPTRNGRLYVCQSTALAECSHDIPSWDIRHLVREVVNGELTLVHFTKIMVLAGINKIRLAVKLSEIGTLAGPNRKNSKGDLSLEPGDRVAVKTPAEIKATLDPTGRNAGLTFEPDMALCAGHEYEVAGPVQRIILEQTGEMRELTHTVTLKGVVCSGLCAKNCPRANPIFWRESWLKRTDAEPGAGTAEASSEPKRETVSA